MTYDQIVIFMDFKDRAAETVNYFDNLTIGGRTASISNLMPSTSSIYPNPTADQVILPVNTATFTINNMEGQELLSGQNNRAHLGTLATGMYIINAVLEDGTTAFWKVSKI